MRFIQRAWWLLLRFVGSYVGLAILPLVIIVVSMSAIATTQADRILFRFISYPGSTFEVLDNADYSGRREVRSSVIRFEGGVANQVREAITTFGGSISAVSHRVIEEARREEAARTAAGSSSAFSLSADSQRASSAVALSGAAVQSAMGGASVVAAPAPVLPPGAVAVAMVTPVASTPTLPPASPPATPTQALSVAAITTSTPVQSAPASAPVPASGAATPTPIPPPPPTLPATNAAPATTGTPVPAVAAPTLPVVSAPTLPVVATTPSPPATLAPTVAPTQMAQSSATAIPPSPTARETATAIPPTTTPVAATATPEPRTAGGLGATATATLVPTSTPLPTSTALPTVTVPEMALDLSVPGGSSMSLQPIFSGDLSMRAGESTVRTVSVQNNGTRTFRYSLNTSGGDGPLWNDAASGLQMSVVRNGSEVYRGPLSMPDQLIGQLSRGGQDTLVITVWLPATADNSFQGLSTTVSYNFTAVAVLSGP